MQGDSYKRRIFQKQLEFQEVPFIVEFLYPDTTIQGEETTAQG